ncbi:MAG: hypothetical protein WAV78_25475, partial [Xanthobacteraceae bacterium]
MANTAALQSSKRAASGRRLELLYKGGDPQEVRRRAQEEGRKAREAAEAAASNTFIAVFDKF